MHLLKEMKWKVSESDLINKYERFLQEKLIEYKEKCPRMREKRLNYLNEYTHLLGTSEYGSSFMVFHTTYLLLAPHSFLDTVCMYNSTVDNTSTKISYLEKKHSLNGRYSEIYKTYLFKMSMYSHSLNVSNSQQHLLSPLYFWKKLYKLVFSFYCFSLVHR